VHEYSIIQALLERVEHEAHARGALSVSRLAVRIGELSGVEQRLLETAYETFRERTLCENAALDVTFVPARWGCPACGVDIPSGAVLSCRDCGSAARLVQGEEIMLDRIEMEVP